MTEEQYEAIIILLTEIQKTGGSDPYRLVLYLVPNIGIIFGTTLLFFCSSGGINKRWHSSNPVSTNLGVLTSDCIHFSLVFC